MEWKSGRKINFECAWFERKVREKKMGGMTIFYRIKTNPSKLEK